MTAMQYANIGRTGLRASRICLGTMPFGSERVLPIIKKVVDSGVNFFGTANIYARGKIGRDSWRSPQKNAERIS